jgi:hypothetical protein
MAYAVYKPFFGYQFKLADRTMPSIASIKTEIIYEYLHPFKKILTRVRWLEIMRVLNSFWVEMILVKGEKYGSVPKTV